MPITKVAEVVKRQMGEGGSKGSMQIDIPSFLHKGRENKKTTSTALYMADNDKELQEVIRGLPGKSVKEKYKLLEKSLGEPQWHVSRKTKPFLLNRGKYKKFTENPMDNLAFGLRENEEQMRRYIDDALLPSDYSKLEEAYGKHGNTPRIIQLVSDRQKKS